MNREILRITLPAIATNITVPLLSLVDITIAGHLGSESYLCAISLGGTLINMLYWNFGFLRMGTSGLTAQAYGADDKSEMSNLLIRSLVISLSAALLIFLLRYPVQFFSFHFMQTTPDVEAGAISYLSICIAGAPAMMCLYGFKGWFIGMQNSTFPMIVAISVNVINILCSLFFVFILHWGIEGIATGTMFSQYCGLLIAFLLWKHRYKSHMTQYISLSSVFDWGKLKKFASLNGYIAIRTLCLTAVTTFFPLAGARQGTTLLAVNTLLMQFFSIFSYFTDGFAYAGEALVGRYTGAKDYQSLNRSIHLLFRWGIGLVVVFTIIYAIGSNHFIQLLTDDKFIIKASEEYQPWLLLIPLCGFAAFLWDGIMVGATMAKGMVLSMVISAFLFFFLYNSLIDPLGNNGLWIAFLSYLACRGIVQAIYYRTHSFLA